MLKTISSESPACMTEGWLHQTSLNNWTNVVKNMSTSMVKSRFCEVGIYDRTAVKKLLLSKQNNVKRPQWAKLHKDWSIEPWNKGCWVDKSRFKIFGLNRRVYIWQKVGESVATLCIITHVKHGRSSEVGSFCQLQSWGFAPCVDWIRLAIIKYCSITQSHLECSLWFQGFVLMQDNDPKHMSQLFQSYIKGKEEHYIFQLTFSPVRSVDLNPIELLWDEIDWKVRAKQPTIMAHLWQLLQESWVELSSVYPQHLVERMPRICEAGKTAKSRHFDESKV